MVTVFTPTYNRAYTLQALYESLCRQRCHDFEWLVVDDGSTDQTEALISSFIAQKRIRIRYHRQPNGGKHRAINTGVGLAEGELFFIVDSDDFLTEEAIEFIQREYQQIKGDAAFAGLSGYREDPKGARIGGPLPFDRLDCNALDFRLRHKIRGDMAEVYRTEILKKYPFPEVEGERFCPEALIWNRIAQNYLIRWLNRGIYVCEYLADGLTARITRLRMQSPQTAQCYYAELAGYAIPWREKIKAGINFWRFACCTKRAFRENCQQIGLWALPLIMPGWLMHLNDKRQ